MRKHLSIFLLLFSVCLATPGLTYAEQKVDPDLRKKLIDAVNDTRSFRDKYLAEVWLTDMSARLKKYIRSPVERINMLRILHEEATRARIPPEMILALIEVESAFNRYAISYVGARGLMQVMPFWLKEIGKPHENMFDIRTNLRMGCTILRFYLDREKGDKRKALARYNGSVGKRKYPDKVFNALSKRWYRQ